MHKKHRELKLALPKGRMQEEVFTLLRDAGIGIHLGRRTYRPGIDLPEVETKLLKPQNIIKMLHIGSRDLGFAGADWVEELGADLVELLDTGLNPVKIVAACPKGVNYLESKAEKIVVASEYDNLTRKWICERKLDATFLKSYGATEVFPPEDADCIVDNLSSGETLRANSLHIIDELRVSSTRLYANPEVMKDSRMRNRIEDFVTLIKSVIDARRMVMIEVNVDEKALEEIIRVLPSMKEATVASLYGGNGFSVKAAVSRKQLHELIPRIKACGGNDIVTTDISNIII